MSGCTCDTSVLVPALTAWHVGHDAARDALRRVDVLPAHVLVECYSLLTRLPGPHRVAAADAASALDGLRLPGVDLPADRCRELVAVLAAAGVAGGAVYDGLVAATAAHHDLLLLTRDRRARPVYDLLGVRHAAV